MGDCVRSLVWGHHHHSSRLIRSSVSEAFSSLQVHYDIRLRVEVHPTSEQVHSDTLFGGVARTTTCDFALVVAAVISDGLITEFPGCTVSAGQ